MVSFFMGCDGESDQTAIPLSVEAKRTAIESAMIHLDSGRSVEALAITSKLLEHDGNSLEILEKHAIVLLAEAARLESNDLRTEAMTKREEAMEVYKRACTQDGVSGGTQFSAGQLAHMLGDTSLARTLYEQSHLSLEVDGRSAFYLAQIYMLEEQWTHAHNWIQESLQRQPNEGFSLVSAGLIDANLGNCDSAKMHTDRAVQIKPNDANVRIMQARVLRLCNEPYRALELLAALPGSIRSSQIVRKEIDICQELLRGDSNNE